MAKDYQQELVELREQVSRLQQELATVQAAVTRPVPTVDLAAQHLATLNQKLAQAKADNNPSLAAWLSEQIRLTTAKKG